MVHIHLQSPHKGKELTESFLTKQVALPAKHDKLPVKVVTGMLTLRQAQNFISRVTYNNVNHSYNYLII